MGVRLWETRGQEQNLKVAMISNRVRTSPAHYTSMPRGWGGRANNNFASTSDFAVKENRGNYGDNLRISFLRGFSLDDQFGRKIKVS